MRLLLAIVLSLAGLVASNAAVYPTANQADWTSTGAYATGIPDTSGWTVVTAATAGLTGDCTNGTDGTDNQTALQNWINGLSNNSTTVLQFGTGGYRWTGQINIPTTRRILFKGNGQSGLTKNTKIWHNTTGDNSTFRNFTGSMAVTNINISSGYTQGSTTLTFASSGAISSIAVNDWIFLSQLNDATIPVTNVGAGGAPNHTATWVGPSGTNGDRAMCQIVQVTGKSGATLTLGRNCYYTFQSGNTPQIQELAMGLGSGFEDLSFERTGDGSNAQETNFIKFDSVYYGWVKNCYMNKNAGAGVYAVWSYGITVRDCYIHNARQTVSGHGYAITFFGANSDHFVFNNYADNERHSFITEGPSPGTIWVANYDANMTSTDTPDFLFGSTDTHGAHNYVNLYEQGWTGKQCHDNTLGTASNNTWFRYVTTGQGTTTTYTNGLAASVIEENSHSNALIACIVGQAGQTGKKFSTNGDNTSTRSSYRWGFLDTGSTNLTDAAVATTTVLNGTYDFISNGKTDLNAGGLDAPDATKSLLYGSTRPSWATKWWPLYDPNYPTQSDANNIPIYYAINNSNAAYPNYTPGSMSHGSATQTTIPLTWTDNATGETGYVIYRSTDGGSNYSERTTVAANSTSYTDTGLTPNTTYFYKVAAYLGSTFTTSPDSSSTNATTLSGSSTSSVITGSVTVRGSVTIR